MCALTFPNLPCCVQVYWATWFLIALSALALALAAYVYARRADRRYRKRKGDRGSSHESESDHAKKEKKQEAVGSVGTDSQLSKAVIEAYASAPAHSASFSDSEGVRTSTISTPTRASQASKTSASTATTRSSRASAAQDEEESELSYVVSEQQEASSRDPVYLYSEASDFADHEYSARDALLRDPSHSHAAAATTKAAQEDEVGCCCRSQHACVGLS